MSDSEDGSKSGSPLPPILLDEDNNEGGNTIYKYRDFSTMPEEPDAEEENNNNQRGSLESSIRVQKFPVKLYAILAQKEFHDIITWMPHGRSWKVLKPNLFESMVMPLFFEYSNYHSFNRLVNAWSFRRISSGPDRGSYYHELFLRGKPHLQKYMRRLPKTHKKLPMKKEDEPDFYKMDKECALPPLEEIQLSAPKIRGAVAGQQPLGFSPVAPGQGLQRPNVALPRMFPEGVGSQEVFDQQDGGFLGGRGQSRSPTMGGSGLPGMRDPANFKSMEFKPSSMEIGSVGFGGQIGSQMMSPMNGMMGSQMGQGMMGSQMGQGMMGSQMGQGMGAQMGQGMMGAQMGAGMMSPQMGSQMMGSQMMGSQMGAGMMGSGMIGPQMGSQMGSQMGGHMGNPMGQMDQFQNLQRLRQIQHMQLFERQNLMNPVAVGGEEGYGRMGSFHPHC